MPKQSHHTRAPSGRLISPQAPWGEHLRDVDEWDYDIFALSTATNEQPLPALFMHILRRRGLLRSLDIAEVCAG